MSPSCKLPVPPSTASFPRNFLPMGSAYLVDGHEDAIAHLTLLLLQAAKARNLGECGTSFFTSET